MSNPGTSPSSSGSTSSATRPVVRTRTITTLRERLVYATRAYGDVPLRELERMAGELAAWQAMLPERWRYGSVQALRQTLAAAVRRSLGVQRITSTIVMKRVVDERPVSLPT